MLLKVKFPNISLTSFLSSNVKYISVLKHTLIFVGVLLKFYLHLISYHISAFDSVATFLRRQISEFCGDQTFFGTITNSL